MIIDLILDRADGTPYNAHDFYTDDAPILNPICEACKWLRNGCDGTTEKKWTGCIYRET